MRLLFVFIYLSSAFTVYAQQKVSLNNIFFETDKAELLPKSYEQLDKAVDILFAYPYLKVIIAGHTDNTGTDQHNMELSKSRAVAVYGYLTKEGISKSRLQYVGYGSIQPILSNDTERGRSWNRRVEFIVQGSKTGNEFSTINQKVKKITKTITGQVVDENEKPVKATVTIKDIKGRKLAEEETDDEGNFSITAEMEEESKHNLIFKAKGHFFDIITFIPGKLKKVKIKKILSKIVAGKNYNFDHINFYGDRAIFLPEAKVPLLELYSIMADNPKLKIRIEGHTHGVGTNSTQARHQDLSERRAIAVEVYLRQNGIDKNRLSTVGYGCSKMLFPDNPTTEQAKKNRRVEIVVIEK